MPKIGVFKLVGANEGKTVNLGHQGQYKFVDGALRVKENDARLMEPVLTRYYGAELSYEDIAEPQGAAPAAGSLAKSETKPGAAPAASAPEKKE